MPFNLKRTDCFEHLVNDDRLEVAVATAVPGPLKQALSWSFISNSLKKTYQVQNRNVNFYVYTETFSFPNNTQFVAYVSQNPSYKKTRWSS